MHIFRLLPLMHYGISIAAALNWMPYAQSSDTKGASYVGLWKITFASLDPNEAQSFVVKYLGAAAVGMNWECVDLAWVYYPSHLEGKIPKEFAPVTWSSFNMHFVKQSVKPEGSYSIAEFVQTQMVANNSGVVHHLVMQTYDLDPIASKIAHDEQPYLVWTNPDGTFSMLIEIPQTSVVEINAQKLTVFSPPAIRCAGCTFPRQRPQIYPRILEYNLYRTIGLLTPQHLNIMSTNPKASADYMAKYFSGVRGNLGAQLGESHSVSWRMGGTYNRFDVTYSKRPSHPFVLKNYEEYVNQLHGNLTFKSAVAWDAYMDYHSGFMFENCDPILKQLDANNEPYFLVTHLGTHLSVVVKDPSGYIHEAVCGNWSLVQLEDVVPWDFCAASDSAETLHGLLPVEVNHGKKRKVSLFP